MNAAAVHRPTLTARLRAMPKQHLALIALVPVLIVVWIPLVGGGDRNAPAAQPPADVAAAPVPAAAPGALPAPAAETAAIGDTDPTASSAALIARLRALTAPYTPRWTPGAGEPFRSAPLQAAVEVASSAEPALAPSAIVLSGGAPPVAIVQGRACSVGDSVGGRTIVAIEERRVVYRTGELTFAVVMPAPQLGERK